MDALVFEFMGLAMLVLCVIVLAVPAARRPSGRPARLLTGLISTNERIERESDLHEVASWRENPAEMLSRGYASLEFAARPLTYQRFRPNALVESVMDRSWI